MIGSVVPKGTSFGRLAKKILNPRLSSKFTYSAEGGKENPPPLRDFLKTVGSNFILKDLTLLFLYSKPYDIFSKSQEILDWRCIAAEVRNYFKGQACAPLSG